MERNMEGSQSAPQGERKRFGNTRKGLFSKGRFEGCQMVARGEPRSVKGGRSGRYEERRSARGSTGTATAPAWTDGAATAILDQIHKDHNKSKVSSLMDFCLQMMLDHDKMEATLERASNRLSLRDWDVAAAILDEHASRIETAMEAGGEAAAKKKVHSFLKPMREKAQLTGKVVNRVLEIPALPTHTRTIAEWFHPHPDGLKVRPIAKSKRTLGGLAKWPLGWMDRMGVVCYERAANRVTTLG